MNTILKFWLSVILVAMSSIAYSQANNKITFYETPTAYEGKTSTSFKVFQVLDDCALASEASDNYSGSYSGKTVLIIGERLYDDQIVHMTFPMMIGVFKYESKGGSSKTVPVIQQLSQIDNRIVQKLENTSTVNTMNNALGYGGNEGIGLSKYESNISCELEGRTLRGSKIVPVYINKEDGIVVIRIAVNANGEVIIAEVAPGTTITTKSLQVSAIAAAKRTKFNAIAGKEDQAGTITYKFELR